MYKKTAVLILAIFIVFTLLACGKTPEESTTGTSMASESTAETEKFNLERYEFTWINSEYSYPFGLYFSNPANADEQAIMDVCGELEREYNFTFSNKMVDAMKIDEELITAGISGTKSGDFIMCDENAWGEAALSGYLRRLDTDEVRACGMDVRDGRQFDPYLTAAGKVGGQAFVTAISGEHIDPLLGCFYAFNKRFVANAGYSAEVIYQAVRDGDWTWDVYIDICKAGAVYDGESGEYTVWGNLGYKTVEVINTMCEGIVTYRDGKYVSNSDDILLRSAMSTLIGRLLGDPAVYQYKTAVIYSASPYRFFHDQSVIFMPYYELKGFTKITKFAYGVVPIPRGGAAKGYASLLLCCPGYCLQSTNGDWEKSCFIFGKLGEALGDTEAAVERLDKLLPDAESVEMVREYILPNIRMEYVYLNQKLTDMWFEFYIKVRDAYQNGAKLGESIAGAAEYAEQFDAAVEEAFKGVNK